MSVEGAPAQGTEIHTPAVDSRSNKLSNVVNELLQQHGGEAGEGEAAAAENVDGQLGANTLVPPKEATLDNVIDDTVARTRQEDGLDPKPQEGKEKAPEGAETKPEGEPEDAPGKIRLQVDGKDYDLTPDQAQRYAQKGIHLEKRSIDINRNERAVKEGMAGIQQKNEQFEAMFKEMQSDPMGFAVRNLGVDPDEVWNRVGKQRATEHVRREMEEKANPHLKDIRLANERADAAERLNNQTAETNRRTAETAQVKELQTKYQKVVVDALEQGGVPRTDFTVKEMVQRMRIAASKGIDYNAQDLANIVKDDNILRVKALTDSLSTQIDEARKAGSVDGIIASGEQLANLLGENVVHGLVKYYLAKQKRPQPPANPTAIVDTAKVTGEKKEPKQYMSWDDYDKARKARVAAMERGEPVSDNW